MDDLFATHDALAVAHLMKTRKLGASEVLGATLKNLRRLNASLNAITDFYDDAPTAGDGPFHGVPYVIKQLMADCAGHPTTLGSKFFARTPVASADSAAVARMRRTAALSLAATGVLAKNRDPSVVGWPAQSAMSCLMT